MTNTRGSGYTSAENVLRALWMLHENESVRVIDVAEALGIAQSTAHRLLNSLVEMSMAVRGEKRTYQISQEYVTGFSGKTFEERRAELMREMLAEVAETTGETAHFSVLRHQKLYVMDGVESSNDLRVASRKGRYFVAHQTVAGRLILRDLDDENFWHLFSDQLPPDLGSTEKDIQAFRQRLLNWREDYASTHGGAEAGISGVAMTLHDVEGRPLGAVSVNAPSMRLRRSDVPRTVVMMRKILQRYTERLSQWSQG